MKKKDRQPRYTPISSKWTYCVYRITNQQETPKLKKRLHKLWRNGYSFKDAAAELVIYEQKLNKTAASKSGVAS